MARVPDYNRGPRKKLPTVPKPMGEGSGKKKRKKKSKKKKGPKATPLKQPWYW